MRNKKDLIEKFIENINNNSDIDKEWSAFIKKRRHKELEQIITEEQLNPEETNSIR